MSEAVQAHPAPAYLPNQQVVLCVARSSAATGAGGPWLVHTDDAIGPPWDPPEVPHEPVLGADAARPDTQLLQQTQPAMDERGPPVSNSSQQVHKHPQQPDCVDKAEAFAAVPHLQAYVLDLSSYGPQLMNNNRTLPSVEDKPSELSSAVAELLATAPKPRGWQARQAQLSSPSAAAAPTAQCLTSGLPEPLLEQQCASALKLAAVCKDDSVVNALLCDPNDLLQVRAEGLPLQLLLCVPGTWQPLSPPVYAAAEDLLLAAGWTDGSWQDRTHIAEPLTIHGQTLAEGASLAQVLSAVDAS